MRKIFRAVFIITFFSVLTRLGGFMFRVYLSRTIGAEGMGIYQITMSVFGLLVTLTSSGIPLVVSKRTAELTAVDKSRSTGGTVTAALIIAVAVSAVAAALIFFGQSFLEGLFTDKRNLEMLIVLLPAVVVSSFYAVFRGGLWGQKKFFTYGLLEFFEQYVRVGIGIVMLQGVLTLTQGTMRAALSLSISYIVAAVIAAIVYFAAGEKLGNPRPHFKPVLKSAVPITLIRIAGNLIGSLISLIIPLRLIAFGLGKSEALAQFGAAAGMALPLLSIPITLVSSLALALVPELSGAQKNGEKLSADINTAIKFSVILGGLFMAFFIVSGPDIGMLLYDNALAGEIIRLGAISVIPSALTVISGSILNSLGLEMKALKCYLFTAGLLLAGTWVLPAVMGISGMVVASFVSGLVGCAFNIAIMNKAVPVGKTAIKSTVITFLLIIPVALISYLLHNLLISVLPVSLVVAIICVFSVGLYILMCYVFNLVDIAGIVRTVKNRKQKNGESAA